MARLLAADVGGTNCRLALFDGDELVASARVPTAGPGLPEAAAGFLAEHPVEAAGIAVAGPVRAGRAALTNHAWTFDERELGERLGAPAVLLNDFAAAALGIPALPDGGWRLLAGPPPDRDGTLVAVGPGTGLGQAALVRTPSGWQVLPGEGGHVDLGPGCEQDLALWRHLSERHGHASWERVLSGEGLLTLHAARRAAGIDGPEAHHPAEVTSGRDPAARAAVEDFARLLGAFAGNAALTFLPVGGVWLCGGIVPRLAERLDPAARAFTDKGRFGELLAGIPLALVLDEALGLRGAARAARSALSS